MSYHHRARKVTCASCRKQVAWFTEGPKRLPERWKCECGVTNHIDALPQWPDVPKCLYIGPDKIARFKVYPYPPDRPDAAWAQPYSIRSFVYQAAQKFGGCYYHPRRTGTVMDEPVFQDGCYESQAAAEDEYAEPHDCHLVGGWITGHSTCALWEHIAGLCQTDSERNFLRRYLGYVKDRQFPMLIPQTWIGITERRRPDFVAFVPLQYWRYKWLAIQLDAYHTEEQADDDANRDDYVRGHKYEVLSIKPPEGRGYFEEVRSLVERVEQWMNLADTQPWDVAAEANVTKVVPDDDPPF